MVNVNDTVLRDVYFNLRFGFKENFVILLIDAGMRFSKFSCCYLLCIRPHARHCPWNGTLQTQSAQKVMQLVRVEECDGVL